jgi:uncharacterized membrane protein
MKHIARLTLLTLLLMIWQAAALAIAQGPVARAVLFFSPTCPHCHEVINEDLPVIFRRFGGDARVWFDQGKPREEVAFYLIGNGQLEILLVDASLPDGNAIYTASAEALQIPDNRQGVPRLVVSDSVLVGSQEIPTILPTIIEEGLAAGGIAWPDITGLDLALATFPMRQPPATGSEAADTAESTPPTDTEADSAEAPAAEEAADASPPADSTAGATEAAAGETDLSMIAARRPGMLELYRRDPVGNGFSVAILIGMLFSLFAVYAMSRQPGTGRELGLAIPALSLLGIVVAGYLAYIESTGAQAVCGPVGDCNTVNQSEYAVLFGVPVGILGLAGYVAIVGAWLMSRRGTGAAADWAKVALLAMAALGTLFSIYLTFLEPFVIGATCAWCLTSAVVMTLVMLLAARPGFEALERVRAA